MAVKKKKPDTVLLLVMFFIILLGLLVFASTSSVESQQVRGNPYDFFLSQVMFGFFPGLILAFIAYKTPLTIIKKWAPWFLLINLILLALVFVPSLGRTMGGSTRWVGLGGIMFQPAEFLKLTLILYLASLLAKRGKISKRKALPLRNTFLPFVVIATIIAIMLIMQPDLSTFVVILFIALVMYFVAKTPLWHTLALVSGSIVGLFALIQFFPYQMSRIQGMINPDLDPLGVTYQTRQALIAVGSGGITGQGLGMSQQKYFLPFSMTDSIFPIYAEELGFIGSMVLIGLFLFLFWRGFLIIRNNKDQFIKLIVIGICSWFFIQTFIHIGAMIGIVPPTGIPLPFISYGRSHLIAEMIGVGILLNASAYGKK